MVSCQRLDFNDKTIFVYVIDKNKSNPSRREISLKKIEDKYGKLQQDKIFNLKAGL